MSDQVILTYPNPTTFAQQMVGLCEKALFDAALSGAESATIASGGGSESYKRYSISEIETLKGKYIAQANREARGGRRVVTLPDFGGRCHG